MPDTAPALLALSPKSHVDHGLTAAQLQYVREQFAGRTYFFIETIQLPAVLGTVLCGLHGPLMGDEPVPESEVVYEQRGTREYASRMCNREPRPTTMVTIIAGPSDGEPCVLYTAFGGPLTPKEANDPTLTNDNRDFATTTWAEHALSRESGEVA